jgi:sporulation protein YlmC with PRC-barrel domain
MIKHHLMLALVGTALATAPAFAQNQPSGTSSAPSGSPPAASQPASPSGSSASAPSTSGSAQFVSQAQSGQWRASKLVGVDIYGSNNEKIGDVNEVLLDKTGKAEAVVIGVGGFLGVGSKEVAVQFSAIEWKDQPPPSTAASGSTSTSGAGSAARPGGTASSSSTTAPSATKVMDYPDHGVLKMTKEQLTSAPEFKYASDTSSSRPASSGSSSPAGSTNR